jgi:hypothetical protein
VPPLMDMDLGSFHYRFNIGKLKILFFKIAALIELVLTKFSLVFFSSNYVNS